MRRVDWKPVSPYPSGMSACSGGAGPSSWRPVIDSFPTTPGPRHHQNFSEPIWVSVPTKILPSVGIPVQSLPLLWVLRLGCSEGGVLPLGMVAEQAAGGGAAHAAINKQPYAAPNQQPTARGTS